MDTSSEVIRTLAVGTMVAVIEFEELTGSWDEPWKMGQMRVHCIPWSGAGGDQDLRSGKAMRTQAGLVKDAIYLTHGWVVQAGLVWLPVT